MQEIQEFVLTRIGIGQNIECVVDGGREQERLLDRRPPLMRKPCSPITRASRPKNVNFCQQTTNAHKGFERFNLSDFWPSLTVSARISTVESYKVTKNPKVVDGLQSIFAEPLGFPALELYKTTSLMVAFSSSCTLLSCLITP